MADEQIVTSIVAKADFSNLIADVHKVTASLSHLQQKVAESNKALSTQIKVMNNTFAETLGKTGQFSSHFVTLTGDVEKFGKNLDSGRLKLRDYYRAWQDHTKTSGGLIRDLAQQQVRLQNAVMQPLGRNAQGLMQFNVHVPRGLDLVKNKTAIARQELSIMNKVIQDGGVQLINWGKNTQWAGRQLTVGLTLPLVAFGKAAADAFKVADQELTRLTKVYGDIAGASSQELAKVREDVSATAKELASAMGVNFSETIALAADIAATGKTGNELLGSISETTRLAVLGEVDRQEAMKATLAIQSAFKQNTEELAGSINFLNAVENQTSTTLNDLVEAIPKAGPVIKGLGGSVQDLALYLTAMREGGITASEGANALKSALASLINPTDVAVEKFKGFGIDLLGIVKNNAGNVTETLFALQAALDQLNPLQKQQAIEQLFGKFQFSRLNALFENLGRQGSQTLQVLDLMKASAGELESVAARELAAVTESASGRFRRAVETLKADLAGVGDDFLDIGTKLINILSKIIDFGQKLPDPIKKLITFGGAFTAIAGPVIMLTGVLANFFGYIIKGVGYFKTLFKGGEGFKLLTPEILAASKAGSLMENTFYSDAKAAAVLSAALEKLVLDLNDLEMKVNSGQISVAPMIQTVGGSVMASGIADYRRVNPGSPLVGGMASAHLNPRDPNNPTTIFGLVPQSNLVNQKIGRTPQIMMEERLPNIEGLTSVQKTLKSGQTIDISTGVVAGEAARYQALMATLGMQSKQEIEALKRTIQSGQAISSDFIQTFDDILPLTTRLSQNAARESAAIVAELKAGRITVEQAKAQIIQVNAQLEAQLGAEVSAYAASRGRTIDLTKAPLIDQPIVDPATGKSNVRALFRRGKMREIMQALGRATRTRTMGAPYSIETTMPRRMNSGGYVYTMNDGNIVPGPDVNKDVVPAMLTPGEFVVNREATAQNLPLLMAINNGMGSRGPGFNNGGRASNATSDFFMSGLMGLMQRSADPDFVASQRMRHIIHDAAGILALGDSYRIPIDPQDAVGMATDLRNDIDKDMAGRPDKDLASISNKHIAKLEKQLKNKYGINLRWKPSSRPTGAQRQYYTKAVKGIMSMKTLSNQDRQLASKIFRGSRARFQGFESEHVQPFETMTERGKPGELVPKYNIGHAFAGSASINKATRRLSMMGISPDITYRDPKEQMMQAERIASGLGYGSTENIMKRENVIRSGIRSSAMSRFLLSAASRGRMRIGRNSGGMIRGYNSGGMVTGYNRGGMIKGYQQGGGPIRGMGMGSMLGMQAASFGGMFAGQSIGSRFGSGGSMAGSIIGSMLPMMLMGAGRGRGLAAGSPEADQFYTSKIDQSVLKNTKLGTSMGLNAVQGSKFAKVLTTVAGGLTKTNLVLAGVTTSLALGYRAWKDYTENQRLSAAAFGLTAETAEKAGLKYTDYTKRIKDSVEAMQLLLDKNKLIYESMASAGTPFQMTIEQYKKLRKEVKSTMQEQIDVLNKTAPDDVNSVAVQLKEQFVAAGMSAEEATKKIYVLFKLSKQSARATSAISTARFTGITDQPTAAISAVETFNKAKADFESTADQARQLNTALTAIDSGIENIMKTSEEAAKKDKTGKTQKLSLYEAEKQQLDLINSKVKEQAPIGQAVLQNLIKQNPEVEKFATASDTILSIWQKLKLQAAGFTGDLTKLNTVQVDQLYKLSAAISESVVATNKTGMLSKQYDELGRLTTRQKELLKATKGQSVQEQINTREALKALDKKIKKINEEADARKKALRDSQDAESYQIELQRAQLEYQQAIATGDMQAAAQAQLNMRTVVGQRQTQLAEDQIEKDRLRKIKPLEAQREAIQEGQQKLADKAALAGESLDSLNKKIATQKTKIDEVNSSMSALKLALIANKDNLEAFKQSDEFKNMAARFLAAAQGAGVKTGPTYRYDSGGKPTMISPEDQAMNLFDSLNAGLDKSLATKGITTTGPIIINGKPLDTSTTGKYDTGSRKAPLQVSGDYKTEKGVLTDEAKFEIIKLFGLDRDQYFKYNGKTYRVARTDAAYSSAILQKADGGIIRGPGTGTSDSIPAMLSSGEYVVRAQAVQNVGVPFLDKINGMAAGGFVTRYNMPARASSKLMMAMGGEVPNLGGNVIMQNTYNIPESFTKEEIGRYIVDLELKALKRAGYDRSR